MACIDVYNNKTIDDIDADILTAVYACVFVFVLVPNVIVSWGIYKYKKEKRPLNASKIILISLVMMQILFGLILLPIQIYIVRTVVEPGKQLGCSMMAARGFLSAFFLTLCLNITILVSTERNVLITDRKNHRRDFSVSRTRWKIILAFSLSTAWGIAYAVLIAQTNEKKLAALYIALAVYIGVILVLAVILNLKILRKVALSMRNSTLSLHNKRNERKLSRTITLIATTMFVCYVPMVCGLAYTANRLLETSASGIEETASKTIIWCTLPVHLNYGLNALVYLLRGGRKLSKFSSIRQNRDSLYNERGASQRQLSAGERSRKMSGQEIYQQMKKKVSTVSATCEVKGGALVIKEAERKSRILIRQKTNFGYVGEE